MVCFYQVIYVVIINHCDVTTKDKMLKMHLSPNNSSNLNVSQVIKAEALKCDRTGTIRAKIILFPTGRKMVTM